MSDSAAPVELIEAFRAVMRDCAELYRSSGEHCAMLHPELFRSTSPEKFVEQMDDLHRGVLVKTFVSMVKADWRWSDAERVITSELLEHLWGRRLEGDLLRKAFMNLSEKESDLRWVSLLRPFEQLPPLRTRVAELETIVTRLANLVAKIDGVVHRHEVNQLKTIQQELDRHLNRIPLDEPGGHEEAQDAATAAVRDIDKDVQQFDKKHGRDESRQKPAPPVVEQKPREERLQEALEELNNLIGLENIKRDVRELTNFLKVQEQRREMGLPTTPVGLHMVFNGNPGTGKTTVARIVGRILGALGVLKKGHVIECDRSALVARFAGQTGPKTNKKIDEALDGVLFIDEAYSLVAERGDDPFGHEAVQALLKRMEDDRQRLVVILAGYPQPMEDLLKSNPGLSSRFNRHLLFPDYTAVEMACIFQLMCEKNHYELPPLTRAKLLLGLEHLVNHRDEHFGNGRLARNVFEGAIRRLANRIAGVAPLTRELLTTLQADDVLLKDVPEALFAELDSGRRRYRVVCSGCQKESRLRQNYLGKEVKCNACQHRFTANWGEVIDEGD